MAASSTTTFVRWSLILVESAGLMWDSNGTARRVPSGLATMLLPTDLPDLRPFS